MKTNNSYTIPFITLLIICCNLWTSSSTFAQEFGTSDGDPTVEIDEALMAFKSTDFMQKFDAFRNRAEQAIGTYKADFQGNVSREDNLRVRKAYQKTAAEFNATLEQVKQDFLNKRKRKSIKKFPNSYAKSLETDMYHLRDVYERELHTAMTEVTDGQIDGSPLIELLVQLLGLTGTLTETLKGLAKRGKRYKAGYLDEHFVVPHSFKEWEAIDKGSGSGF